MNLPRLAKSTRSQRGTRLGQAVLGTALVGVVSMVLAACGSTSDTAASSSGDNAPASESSQSASSAPADSSTVSASSSEEPAPSTQTIKIAALAFPEGQLIANVYSLALQDAGFKTTLIQTQGRETAEPALSRGDVDLDVEYSSSMLEYYQQGASTTDTDKNLETLRPLADAKNVTVLDPSPATDNYAFGVATKFAQEHNLKTLADLATYSKSNPVVVAGIQECETRSYCLAGLKSVYGLNAKEFKVTVLSSQDSVDKLLDNTFQLVQFDSSDGVLADNPVTILDDPKGLNHPDHIVPAVYTPAASTALKDALNAVQAKLTQELLNAANKQIQIDRAPVAAVAQDLYKQLKG